MKVHNEYGQSWFLAAALIDGPRSLEQLKEYYHIVARRFGMFINMMDKRSGISRDASQDSDSQYNANDSRIDLEENLRQNLSDLLSSGWIEHKDNLYHITDIGREQAELMLKDLERSGRFIEKSTQPETVSTVTLIVHFVLAAVKLPAALLSGSVGLLNDSLDTLMDGISSLFVYFGLRSGRERLVSYILLLFMAVTGLYSLYEAIRRFLNPVALEGDLTSFVAVSVSALFCAILWIYQKFSGLRHSCVPLIAQSIDSRNHIIVAGGVAAGLIAAKFNIILLDQLVGLTVAILILKGAAELLIDLLRSSDEEELDLSKYGFQRLDRSRHRQFVRWFLFEIEKGRITTRGEMFREAHAATDFNQIASLRALGLAEQSGREQKIEAAAEEVFTRKLAEEVPRSDNSPDTTAHPASSAPSAPAVLRLTPAGEAELHRALSDSWSHNFNSYRAFLIRSSFSVLFFSILFAAARGFIGLLNTWFRPLETWSGTSPAWITQLTQSTFSVGPLTFNPIHVAGFLIGLVLFYHGRMISHRASHAIHHARQKLPNRNADSASPASASQASQASETARFSSRRSEKPRYLISKGPYAYRRHPMYTGHLLINIGLAIALHSVYVLAWSALAVSVQLAGAFREEHQLNRWFPREYPEYCRRVKRRFLSAPLWVIIAVAYTAAWVGIFF